VIQLNVKGEVTFVATKCGDILTPLHLQAGLHYSRVTQLGVVLYTKLTTTDACTTLVVYKKAQTWLIREPCNYTTMAKVYLHTSAVKLGEKIYIPVYCTLFIFCTAFYQLRSQELAFPYTSAYDLKVTQYIQARYSGVTSVKHINENLLESISIGLRWQ